jgi:hypothetical protein
MAGQDGEGKDLTVRGVYQFFKALESATNPDGKNALESFLTDCDQKNLTLGVSDALWSVGHTCWNAIIHTDAAGIHTDAAGPGCPACSGPPRL